MTIMYCTNCERIVYEGKAGRQALDLRDVHEFDRDHVVLEFAEVDDRLVIVVETVEV